MYSSEETKKVVDKESRSITKDDNLIKTQEAVLGIDRPKITSIISNRL